MQDRQFYAHRKIISNSLSWPFEAWKMTFVHAMNTRQNISKPILSKAKEKGINGHMYILLQGEKYGHPAQYKCV